MCRVVARCESRIGVIRGRDGEPYQTFRGELQEMAKGAAERRDDGLDPADADAVCDPLSGAGAPLRGDAFARAERIRAFAAQLCERESDRATGEQIDALVATILSAKALRDPADPRAVQLAEVLGLLERRVQAMLAAETNVQQLEAETPPPSEPAAVTPREPQAGRGAVVRHISSAHTPSKLRSAAELLKELSAFETRSAPATRAVVPAAAPAGDPTQSNADDPLAALMALSEEERLALFS